MRCRTISVFRGHVGAPAWRFVIGAWRFVIGERRFVIGERRFVIGERYWTSRSSCG